MADDRDQRIRERAYAIWERQGRPEGRHDEHWSQAAEEVDGESGAEDRASPQPSDGASSSSKRPPAKGAPRKSAAEQGPGEDAKRSSGRTASTATGKNGPAGEAADKIAPRKANPRPKPRKKDTAAKASNDPAVRE
jgi:hypothetical protein